MHGVVFLQLPPPKFSLEEAPTNIPLAAGFLVSALKASRSPRIRPHILRPDIADLLADQGVIEAVVERHPSVVAMTLYVWNVMRSLYVASEIKKRLPGVSILVGGPEVTPDNEWLHRHPAPDAGVLGEGESRISGVLESLSEGRPIPDLPGVFWKTPSGEMHLNASQAPPFELASISYPYLDGVVGPSRDGTLFLETVRGCPFRCRYCYYHKAFQTVRLHPWESLQKVLDFAYESSSGVKEIYLMDPTFNTRPRFRDLLRSVIRRRTKDVPVLHAELRADLLSRQDVTLLREAGLTSAEVGLQTTSREALEVAGREGDPAKTARGIAFLKETGIEVITGIIIGLPQDTPKGFFATVDWLKRTGAYSVVHPFVLSVLPGTDFRQRASQLGLRYDSRPPYYVWETPTFPASEMRTALLACEDAFEMELDHIPVPSLVDRGSEPASEFERISRITKWIVDPLREEWKRALPRITSLASDPFTFWLRGNGGEHAERAALGILDSFAQANPHTVTAVVVELDRLPSPGFFQQILDVMAQPAIYANSSFRPLLGEAEVVTPILVLLVPDPGSPRARRRLKEYYSPSPTVVWDVGLPDEELLSEAEPPLLISLPYKINPADLEWLLSLLKALHGECPNEILFRDADLARGWITLTSSHNAVAPPESIVRTL
jgi:radical SAM superfamily enzyme YgiQ (UPF0313 family)